MTQLRLEKYIALTMDVIHFLFYLEDKDCQTVGMWINQARTSLETIILPAMKFIQAVKSMLLVVTTRSQVLISSLASFI